MITISGILKTPAGAVLANTEIKFYAVATASTVLQGTTGLITTGSDGSYSVILQQGSHRVTVRQGNTRPEAIGMVHISADTTAATLNELLLSASAASPGNPLSDEILAARDLAEAAAAEGEATRTATQALRDQTQALRNETSQISGLNTVAQAIAAVRLPEPDVLITFNDGLRIERGYGTFDQVDVSAAQDGSIMIDLPTRSVDFSRASSSTGINKSGELVTVAVDTPVITSDGLQVYGSATNKILYSETDGANWPIKNSPGFWAGTPTTKNGITFDKYIVGDVGYNDYSSTSPKAAFSVFFYVDGVTTGTAIVLRGEVRGDSVLTGTVTFDYDSKEFRATLNAGFTYRVEPYADNVYRICIEADTNVLNVTTHRVAIYENKNWLGGFQIEDSSRVTPYTKTEATAVTRSPDVVSIPARNNLPAPGKPFTIVVDCAAPLGYGASRGFIRVGTGGTGPFIRRASNDVIEAYMMNAASQGKSVVSTADNNTSKRRFILRYTGTVLGLYINGIFVAQTGCVGAGYSANADIFIGSHRGVLEFLDSSLSFSIYHTALSDEQITALGGPQ